MNEDVDEGSSTRKLAVVTGASAGIGAATARALAARGFHVLAGVRRPKDAEALRTTMIEPIMLDITQEEQIAALARRIADDPERRPLGVLVNNAGLGVNAPVETLPMAEWRRLFDVNLFGHVAVTQALLPALIESRGTVVNISSVGGRVAMATYGPYAGSKFALEAVSDSLRREVAPLGVRVIVIEPGAVTTDLLSQVGERGDRIVDEMTPDQRGRYESLMGAVVAQAKASMPNGAPPEEAARVIVDAITSERPRARYTVGRGTGAIVRLVRLLPDHLLDKLLARNLRPYTAPARS